MPEPASFRPLRRVVQPEGQTILVHGANGGVGSIPSFHGPDGVEADYFGLTNYFKAIRAAFDERSIRRGIADRWVSSIDFVNAAGLRPQDSTFVGLSNFPSFNRNHAGKERTIMSFGFF
jgi:hypothetical protein